MNKLEYIDRAALIERINTIYCAGCDTYNKVCCRACLISDALDCIADAPAADVVPVVRCKDCGYYTDYDVHKHKRLELHFCNKFGNITRESDYCSYGIRKNGNDGR